MHSAMPYHVSWLYDASSRPLPATRKAKRSASLPLLAGFKKKIPLIDGTPHHNGFAQCHHRVLRIISISGRDGPTRENSSFCINEVVAKTGRITYHTRADHCAMHLLLVTPTLSVATLRVHSVWALALTIVVRRTGRITNGEYYRQSPFLSKCSFQFQKEEPMPVYQSEEVKHTERVGAEQEG